MIASILWKIAFNADQQCALKVGETFRVNFTEKGKLNFKLFREIFLNLNPFKHDRQHLKISHHKKLFYIKVKQLPSSVTFLKSCSHLADTQNGTPQNIYTTLSSFQKWILTITAMHYLLMLVHPPQLLPETKEKGLAKRGSL